MAETAPDGRTAPATGRPVDPGAPADRVTRGTPGGPGGTPGGPGGPPGRPAVAMRFSPWLVLFALCLGFFMILLDTTIVNIAIPNMIDTLHASLNEILWIINSYILAYAVLLITAGRLGDLYGPKRLFIVGLFIFTASSAACGLAQNPTQLIIARVVQGVGGALLTPQTLSTITVIFPPARRGAAFGIWGAVAGVATITGPTLGGWLVTDWSWRYIFAVNVPIGIIAMILAAVVMPDLRLNLRHRIDWAGTVLVNLGLFLICFGLIEGESYDWGTVTGPVTIPMIIAAGVLVIGVFLLQQKRAQRTGEPLMPFALFRERNFSLMNIVSAGIAFAMLGLFLPLTIYLQSVLGLSALQAGLTVAPMSVVSMVVAPVAGRLADRIGGKYILLVGLTLWSLGMAMVILAAHPQSHRSAFLPGLIVAGIGLGQTFAPLQTIAMHEVQPRLAGAASGIINTTRQMGAVIGSAAVGALLQAQLAHALRSTAAEQARSLPPQFRDQFVAGFRDAASKGLQVGAGQTGGSLPSGIPPQVRPTILELALRTFHDAFTSAMRSSLVLPIAVLGLSVVGVLLVRGRGKGAAAAAEATDAVPAEATAH